MVDKLKAVKEFREKFKKKFFFDVTGFVNVFFLMFISVFSMPFITNIFNFNAYYFFVMLQTANLVFVLWVWFEVKKMRREKI
jgi:hypothetical protein